MTNQNDRNFMWLNREGQWDGSSWDGLTIGPLGELKLRAVPLLDGALPPRIADLPAPEGPAGIAVDRYGTIYFSDPQNNRILRIDGCDKTTAPTPCPGHLRTPRGLLMRPERGALYIAESGDHRIRAVRTATGQSLEVWSKFNIPWTLAIGDSDSTYVVDYGNHKVQKVNAQGDLEQTFWERLKKSGLLTQPVDIAAGKRVFIADQASHAIVVAEASGVVTVPPFGADHLQQPMGMALIGDVLYVGDNGLRCVLAFDAVTFSWIGEALGYQGPVAALAPDGAGGLLVHTGSSISPVRLALGDGFVKQGIFWTNAIKAPADKVVWHRLEAVLADYADTLPADTHLSFFLYTSDNIGDAPLPPALGPSGASPFTDPKWLAQPPDVNDLFIGGAASLYLWIGAWLTGSGLASPSIQQMRVEFDHQTYLANLPALYQKPGVCHDFLLRLLSLFESFSSETEAAIGRLPSLFDPRSAPSGYLPWLADWLGLQLEEDWDEATARQAIAQAFARYGQRGTPVGLRNALRAELGVDAVIQEPLLHAAWWSLPVPEGSACKKSTGETVWQATNNSVLGYTTVLAPAHAQGAVLGTSAVLDQSHLIAESDFGVPLFEDVAFQFNVQVYQGQVNGATAMDQVRAVIEREKPAHTRYHLCVLQPNLRVGFQARVGIDAIVSGPPPNIRLGETPDLGSQTVLGGQPAGRVGSQLRLGVTTLVG